MACSSPILINTFICFYRLTTSFYNFGATRVVGMDRLKERFPLDKNNVQDFTVIVHNVSKYA